jgi:hypothetical protein
MRHVTEGALHAWLDGELDSLPASEAEWIRSHLEGCSECQLRLEDARAIRDGAAAALAAGSEALEPLPSLEELRARAEARGTGHGRAGSAAGGGPGGRARRGRQMAWAASIVLALGAGWMANTLLPRRSSDGRAPDVRYLAPTEALEVPARVGPFGVADEGRITTGGEVSESVPETSDAEMGRGEAAAGASGVEIRDAATAGSAAPAAMGSANATEPQPGSAQPAGAAEEVQKVTLPVSDTGVGVARRIRADLRDESPQAPVRELREAEAPPRALDALVVAAEMSPVAPPEGALSGLPVLAVESVSLSGVLRVRQALETGERVDVYLLREGLSPSMLPDLEAGVNQHVAPLNGGWRVIRGRVPVEVLRALAGPPE